MGDRFRWACIKVYFSACEILHVLDDVTDRAVRAYYLWRLR
jgi:hypothetical protein